MAFTTNHLYYDDLEVGQTVLFADGTVGMDVVEKGPGWAKLKVALPGRIRSHQGINVPSAGGGHQHGFAVGGRQRFCVRAGGKKRIDHRCTAGGHGFRERRRAVAVGDLYVRARPDQQRHRFVVVPHHRPVQRRRPVGLRGVHVGFALNQRLDLRLPLFRPDKSG